jgi:hypothetical protein
MINAVLFPWLNKLHPLVQHASATRNDTSAVQRRSQSPSPLCRLRVRCTYICTTSTSSASVFPFGFLFCRFSV